MALFNSQRTPPKTAQATQPGQAVRPQHAPDTRELRESPVRAAAAMVKEKTSYFRMAFANPYNLSLLFGGLAVSGISENPLLAVATLGAEALWLLYAPESNLLRRVLWDRKLERQRRAQELAERNARLASLEPDQRTRVMDLIGRQEQIHRLSEQNPSFAGDLMRTELQKTDRLVEAFIQLALTCTRYEQYLASIDAGSLERDRRRYENAAGGPAEDPQTGIARKNLEIVTKRLAKIEEIRRYLNVAKGQLDLIENSFQLIADQIVTMQSPQELSGQLDELLDGVEAIEETARDTDRLLGGLDREL